MLGLVATVVVLALGPGAVADLLPGDDSSSPVPGAGLRIEVLDVGQGDAILLRPPQAPAVLVDAGPPGDGIVAKLEEAGVERLGALVVTHDQSDHSGGMPEVLAAMPVERLVYARLGRELRAEVLRYAHDNVGGASASTGLAPVRLAEGGAIRSGRLRLEALWPPPALLAEPLAGADPNAQALVLRARWGQFTMLLTADAEAGAVPFDPGPLDVLKVAHHGSDDAALAALLDRTRPRLAVISVGEGNSFGHPTPGTLATLADQGVPVLRTDRDGTVAIDVAGGRFRVTS